MREMQQALADRAAFFLQNHGYLVENFLNANFCFDLVARSPKRTIVIKVLSNIDALREEQALDLEKVGKLFGAYVFVVGERTKAFSLQKGIVYERYSLPAISVETLLDFLEDNAPFVKYFKGRSVVDLDHDSLKEARVSMGLSLQDVAEKVSLTKESLHRFESGSNATLDNAKRLEEFFRRDLIVRKPAFSPFRKERFDDNIEDHSLKKIRSLGMLLARFDHAPFRAVGEPSEKGSMLIAHATSRPELQRKATALGKTGHAFDSDPLIIAHQPKRKTIEGVAVVGERELEELGKAKELMRLVRERKDKN